MNNKGLDNRLSLFILSFLTGADAKEQLNLIKTRATTQQNLGGLIMDNIITTVSTNEENIETTQQENEQKTFSQEEVL